MDYWSDGLVATLLSLGVLLAIATPLTERIQRYFPMPRAMVAGLLGLVLGPSAAQVLPVARPQLESLVYHGLALVFICMILQSPERSKERSTDVRTVILGVTGLASLQAVIGLGVVIAYSPLGVDLHTGFGLMAPLGFSQGPGQALSLGRAWEAKGFTDGAQIGLIVASLGFLMCTLFGSAWLGIEKRRQANAGETSASQEKSTAEVVADPELISSSAVEPTVPASTVGEAIGSSLMRHLFIITGIYLVTFAGLRVIDSLIDLAPALEGMRATVWGFHFVLALGVAALFRAVQGRVQALPRSDDHVLSAFAGVVVEFTTCAAMTAVSGAVFMRYAGPILSLTLLSTIGSLLVCIALRRWVFIRAPFEHAITLFGTATGTLLTGLALLRVLAPDMRSEAGRNQVLASAGAIPFLAPVMLGALPYLVAVHAPGEVRAALLGVGMFVAYLVVLVALGCLNLRRARV